MKILNVLIYLTLLLGAGCVKQDKSTIDTSLSHADVCKVSISGEAARRRNIQKNFLWRYQTGALHNHQGFLDFDRVLFDPYIDRISSRQVREKILCSYTAVGKTLDAALIYAASDHDTLLEAVKDNYIKSLIASQDSDGYIGYLHHGDKAPLFNGFLLHDNAYICLALLENYVLFGDTESLEAARNFIDLTISFWNNSPVPPGVTPIGITQACFQLYLATGDRKYLTFFADEPLDGRFIDMESVRCWRQHLFPMNMPSEDSQKAIVNAKVHTYRFFLRCIDQLDLNEVQPDPGLELMSDYALAKMINIDQPGMFITGATGRHEGWVEDQDGRGGVGEACAVIHQIWWLSKLLEQRGDLSYGDLMERMVLNHMYAAQNSDPGDGRTRYFVPLSGKRNYRKGAHCCEGNTRRFWARFPELVYYTRNDCIAVNLFTSSTLNTNINETHVNVVQKTRYPVDGEIQIQVEPEKRTKFALQIRIPRWAESYQVRVNGKKATSHKIEGGIEIFKTWEKGDVVQLSLPMDYRWIKGELFYEGRAALMRGPQVFCFSRDQNPGLDSIPLSSVTFDPVSVNKLEPIGTTAMRNGQALTVLGKTNDGQVVEVILTDFPEVNGEETYFRISDPDIAHHDELYHRVNLDKYHILIDGK